MTIQWLSSKRVEGDDADKDTIPVTSLENGYSFTALDTPQEYIWNGVDTWVPIGGAAAIVGGWKEVARTKLLGAGDSILVDISSVGQNKRYYMVLYNGLPSGIIEGSTRLNGDAGNNYANRLSIDGGVDFANDTTAQMLSHWGINLAVPVFGVDYYANLATKEKLMLGHTVNQSTAGAGTAPRRQEFTGKHSQTSNPITQMNYFNTESGNFAIDSEVVVLGWDPTDVHTDNFWEPLASADLTGGASDVLDSSTFLTRNYLWVQYYIEPTTVTATNCFVTFNGDVGNNYARRFSVDGGGDGSNVNQPNLNFRPTTSSYPYFVNMFILNNTTNEKLAMAHGIGQEAVGAGTAPEREEFVGKWANTTEQIQQITLTNNSGGVDFGTKSTIKVWGHD